MLRRRVICFIFLFGLGLALTGCKGRVRDMIDVVRFCRSQVILPEEMMAIENGSLRLMSFPPKGTPILLRYYGPDDCNECAISHMRDNIALVNFAHKESGFEVVVIMSPTDQERETIMAKLCELKLPITIFIDSSFYCESLGVIPNNSNLHSFLLNKEGTPIFFGNPLKSDDLLKSFRKAISQSI